MNFLTIRQARICCSVRLALRELFSISAMTAFILGRAGGSHDQKAREARLRLHFFADAFEMASQGSMRVVAFDEMLPENSGLRKPYSNYDLWLKNQDPARLTEKMRDAERVFRKTGITFAVYGEEEAAERLIPFDIVPR